MTTYSHGDVPEDIPEGTYVLCPYCSGCALTFTTDKDKYLCSMHWRPQSGTKHGFPIDGFNCPSDAFGRRRELED